MHGKVLEIENDEAALKILKALSSEPRLNILEILNTKEMNLNAISKTLNMPSPSVSVNIKKLEEAGLIETEYLPGEHGSQKICKRTYDNILFKFLKSTRIKDKQFIEIDMPVGNYKDFTIKPPCGIASKKGYVGILDDVKAFLEPQHIYASILWFTQGYVSYKFPNNLPVNSTPKKIGFSMEICSEYPIYKEDYPSDITLWINDVEIGTWTSPGDFGNERGLLNPSWWPGEQTQYGLLKIWTIDIDSSYIDGKKISDINLNDLNIQDNNSIDIKIGVKEDAKNVGGINIFGSNFGNYEQDLKLRFQYE